MNVSLLGVTESLALAEMEAQAKAAIVNGTIRAKGNVDVQMLGRLIAKAEVYNGSTLGLYNATVMVVRANAKGSMEALLNAKTIEAATVNVKNDYYAQSEAETGFAGGLVAGIGSASSNVAYATTSSTAKAAFGAAAGGNITGSISLENLGRVSAKALGPFRNRDSQRLERCGQRDPKCGFECSPEYLLYLRRQAGHQGRREYSL